MRGPVSELCVCRYMLFLLVMVVVAHSSVTALTAPSMLRKNLFMKMNVTFRLTALLIHMQEVSDSVHNLESQSPDGGLF